ncbi:MAG: hypothetical protein IKO35_04250, partial [Elusimicrobiaceae bacterium]|nr:hypothetical protein [Elusimicrobiaceae bacterium]
SNGAYTVNKEDLVVSLPNDSDLHYDLYSVGNGDEANLVRVSSDKLEDVRLARYYHVNEGYADQLYCEAKSNNDRANKLCGKLLQGMEIASSDSNYKTYLLNEEITDALCKAKLFWSNTNNTCYMTEAARCTAHGMNMVEYEGESFCGYVNEKSKKPIGEGGKCIATSEKEGGCAYHIIEAGGQCITTAGSSQGCQGLTVNAGGKCIAEADPDAYVASYPCGYGTYDGGVCEANVARGCSLHTTYKNGAKCIAGTENTCNNIVFEGTDEAKSVCEGRYFNSCGASNTYNYGSICEGHADRTCFSGTFKSGAVCNGYVSGGCGTNWNGVGATFESGSTCNGHADGSCRGTFKAGSTCTAYVSGACRGDYSQGGCCVAAGGTCPEGTACQS